jgi:hypothetical protein
LFFERLGLLFHQPHHFAKCRGFHHFDRLTVFDLPNSIQLAYQSGQDARIPYML